MRRPVPPSNFRTRDNDTREDLRRLREGFQELLDWIDANRGLGGVESFNGRIGAVVPAAGDYTASDVGLGNVTNDAQLKRADNDWSGYTVQGGTPAASDKFLIERASDGAKRTVAYSSLGAGSSTYDPVAALAPEFWYQADNITVTSGNVDSMDNMGSLSSIDLTQTGTSRPVTGTDADGKPYVEFSPLTSGFTRWLVANGSASDWKFLHDPPDAGWTIVCVHHTDTVGAVNYEVLFDTANSLSANVGVELEVQSYSAGGQGPWFGMYRGSSGNYVHHVMWGAYDGTTMLKQLLIVRLKRRTLMPAAVAHGTVTSRVEGEIDMWVNGMCVATALHSTAVGTAYSSSNPNGNLTVGHKVSATTNTWDGRLYALGFIKHALSDRQIGDLAAWANTKWAVVC